MTVRATQGAPTTRNSEGQSQHRQQMINKQIKSRYESEKAYFTPRKDKVNPMDAEFIILNQRFCEDIIPYLLVIVPSLHRNAEVRHVIRSVYGLQASSLAKSKVDNATVKLLFLFGRENAILDEEILQESRQYGDIVQIDFLDTYHNLSRKILYGLKWVSIYCSEVEFVLKADEDVFVNIPLLLSYLYKTPYDMKGAVYGYIYRDSGVIRNGRWAVTTDEYPLKRYPHYASGNSYVISGNIIPRLFMMSEHMPYLPIEDAFITGCLVKLIGAKLNHNRRFTTWLSRTPAPCDFVRRRLISTTKVTISLFYKLLDAVQSYQIVCK